VRWFEESLPKLEVTLTETRAALVMEHREEWRAEERDYRALSGSWIAFVGVVQREIFMAHPSHSGEKSEGQKPKANVERRKGRSSPPELRSDPKTKPASDQQPHNPRRIPFLLPPTSSTV